MNFSNKADLITGASSGIGQATAIELAGKNARVMLVARREARLEALKADIAAKGGGGGTVRDRRHGSNSSQDRCRKNEIGSHHLVAV